MSGKRGAAVALDDIERAGQQELLNWFALAGAMEHVGATPTWSEFIETSVFNSNKVFARIPAVDAVQPLTNPPTPAGTVASP